MSPNPMNETPQPDHDLSLRTSEEVAADAKMADAKAKADAADEAEDAKEAAQKKAKHK